MRLGAFCHVEVPVGNSTYVAEVLLWVPASTCRHLCPRQRELTAAIIAKAKKRHPEVARNKKERKREWQPYILRQKSRFYSCLTASGHNIFPFPEFSFSWDRNNNIQRQQGKSFNQRHKNSYLGRYTEYGAHIIPSLSPTSHPQVEPLPPLTLSIAEPSPLARKTLKKVKRRNSGPPP